MALSKQFFKLLPLSNRTMRMAIPFFLLLLLPVTLFLLSQQTDNRSRAQLAGRFANQKALTDPKIPPHVPQQIVVKFKNRLQEISLNAQKKLSTEDINKSKVNFNSIDETTLPPELQELKRTTTIETIEKVFKDKDVPNQTQLKSKTTENLASTYILTLDQSANLLSTLQELRKQPGVEYAELNVLAEAYTTANDPYYTDHYNPDQPDHDVSHRDANWNPAYDYQWNLKKINIEKAWDVATNPSAVTVAVIDTGVDYTHPELGGCTLLMTQDGTCTLVTKGYDFINNDNDPLDDHGHGTHVSGTISSLTNNGIGIASIAKNKIMPVKALNASGSGPITIIAQAIVYATDNGAKVINMSLGAGPFADIPTPLKDALDYANTRNVTVVVAAGNSHDDIGNGYWPANYPTVIAVGASTEKDTLAGFSNFGHISVVAPGGESSCSSTGSNSSSSPCYNIISLKASAVPSTDPRIIGTTGQPQYYRLAGTSMASPHGAALAAMILSKNSTYTPAEVRSIMEYTAVDLGAPGYDTTYGAGRINAQAALELPAPPPLADITSPSNQSITARIIPIYGTASGRDFTAYKIEVGETNNPTTWSTTGVSLSNNGTQSITNDSLGTIDTTTYNNNKTLTIKLTVRNQAGVTTERRATVTIDPQLEPGWPQPINSTSLGSSDDSVFVATDLDNDGNKEVFAQSTGEYFYLFSSQGQILPGWPKYVGQNYITPSYAHIGKPAVGDIDGDGKKEIVATISSTEYAYPGGPSYSALYAMRKDGTVLPGWPKVSTSPNAFSDPILEDLNSDGIVDVVVANTDTNSVSGYNAAGVEVAGKYTVPTPLDSPYLAP